MNTNQLKSPKTTKASSDILCDRLKVINFLKENGGYHSVSKLAPELDIPSRRLRYILEKNCRGFVVKQGRLYGYSRIEEPIPKTALKDVAIQPKRSRQSAKQKLEQLRRSAYEQFKQQPNMTDERAWLKAYQQHPDFF